MKVPSCCRSCVRCRRWTVIVLSWLIACAACHRDMYDQPRYETMESSDFFPDGRSARLPVPGTIARGQLHEDEVFFTGKSAGTLVDQVPIELNRNLLERGQERFNIYCSVCHAPTGTGGGMIVQRGFRRPPSFHIPRLRNAPAGHFFDVMSNGFGAMPSYARQIKPRDRWAIVAYVRALQLSQNAMFDDVPVEHRDQLEEEAPP